jgi:site-specific DNA recombinase
LKKGKRYRYYVCQTSNNLSAAPSKSVRLPAHDVERQVSLRLRSFLQSRDEIICQLGHPEDSSELTYQLVAAALKHAAGWPTVSPVRLKDFIRSLTRRVVVHPDKIRVEVSKRDIRAALIGDHRSPSPQPLIDHKKDPGDVVPLEVEARVKRFRGEMRLVFPLISQPQLLAVASLVKALAKGHEWYGWVLSGEVPHQRSIARKLGLNERYVSRVLQCAFLAPDIVESILDGYQPSDLTFEKLTRPLPLSWAEQRKQLGFSSLRPPQ